MQQDRTITQREISECLSSFWKLLNEQERTFLYDHLACRNYKRGESIYGEGDIPKFLQCVLKGQVKVYRKKPYRRNQTMRMVRSGQFFGYRAYFAEENYVTDACALEHDTQIATIPMECIDRIVGQNPRVAHYFIRMLAKDLGVSDKRSITLTQSHIRGRLAETLLFLQETYGTENDGKTLSVYMSREDLASLANMTTANAIRTLSDFSSENLLAINGRKIMIANEEKLRKIAQLG